MNKDKIRFCPSCKSMDVRFVFGVKNLFGVIPRMECLKCGAYASDFPMAVVKKKDVRKAKIKKRVVNKRDVGKINRRMIK